MSQSVPSCVHESVTPAEACAGCAALRRMHPGVVNAEPLSRALVVS
jgi:hypothetical protein